MQGGKSYYIWPLRYLAAQTPSSSAVDPRVRDQQWLSPHASPWGYRLPRLDWLEGRVDSEGGRHVHYSAQKNLIQMIKRKRKPMAPTLRRGQARREYGPFCCRLPASLSAFNTLTVPTCGSWRQC